MQREIEEEVIENIKTRRSIRNYTDEPVSKETINDIIYAGRFAPSAENRQPWRFIVITNRDFIKELSEMVKEEIKNLLKWRFIKKFSFKELKEESILRMLFGISSSKSDLVFYNAPVVIFIVTKDEIFNDESCACATENMMLAAHSMGLGSCWVGFASILGMRKKLLEKIGVPEGYHIASTLIIGHPERKPKMAQLRKLQADVIKWID
jgi:nitroreductase